MPVIKSRKVRKTSRKIVKKSLKKTSRKPVRKSMRKSHKKTPVRKSAQSLAKFRQMRALSKSTLYRMENVSNTPTKQSGIFPKASDKSVTPFSKTPLVERLYPGRDKSGVMGVTVLERPSEIDWDIMDKK
jgi:hypothetical protein